MGTGAAPHLCFSSRRNPCCCRLAHSNLLEIALPQSDQVSNSKNLITYKALREPTHIPPCVLFVKFLHKGHRSDIITIKYITLGCRKLRTTQWTASGLGTMPRVSYCDGCEECRIHLLLFKHSNR